MDYYMEGGLQRDMFNHELTVPGQWQMAILPNYFTKHEMRHGRFVHENETVTPSYDPMCATLSKGCYPVLVIDPAKLVEPGHGPIENRKMGQLMNESYGFEDWTVDENVRYESFQIEIVQYYEKETHQIVFILMKLALLGMGVRLGRAHQWRKRPQDLQGQDWPCI